jgi:hypothetical protein
MKLHFFEDVSSTISLLLAVGSVYIGNQSSKTSLVCVVRSSGAVCTRNIFRD